MDSVENARAETRPSAAKSVADRRGLTVWFTGLSGAGKTTLCRSVQAELLARGFPVEVLDGDSVRQYLCSDLGFSEDDRRENIKRIAYVAQLLTRNGVVVLVAAISPYRNSREAARASIGNFLEVFVNAPLPVCEARDPKGLYRRARAGALLKFTGIDDPYEAPDMPEVECHTDRESVAESAEKVIASVLARLRES
jgi:adenylyl-sulfate kinase